MGVITSTGFAKLLYPGLNKIYGNAYNEWPTEWTEIFEKSNSERAFEEDLQVTGFGLARLKTEGKGITYDEMKQGFVTRYQHIVMGLGFIITREMYEDNLYPEVGMKKATALASSMRRTKEVIGANVLNRAFNSGYVYGDGKELCSTSLPNSTGGTWRNTLATPADLSEAALEQAFIDISDFRDDRGVQIQAKMRKLIVHPFLTHEAQRILQSELRTGTGNNDLNALKALQTIPEGFRTNHYLSSQTAWFVLTDIKNGMRYFERRADSFDVENDFDTENAKFKGTGRYSFGCSEKRSIFGSAPN